MKALATCLQENVDQDVCYKAIKRMCEHASNAASAKLSWKIKDLIETAKEVYPQLKLESTSDLKPDAEALVASLFKEFGNKPTEGSWEKIIDLAHIFTSPTGHICFGTPGSDTHFKEQHHLNHEETIASTKLLENIARAHILREIAVKEFGQEVEWWFEPFLKGQTDLNFGQIWDLDLNIKQQVFRKNNPEKYAESYVKHYVKSIEANITNGLCVYECAKNLEKDLLNIESLVFKVQDANWQIHESVNWHRVIGYITSMPRMKHLEGKIWPACAESIVEAIVYRGAETLENRP